MNSYSLVGLLSNRIVNDTQSQSFETVSNAKIKVSKHCKSYWRNHFGLVWNNGKCHN